jgi:hypothetical protein
LASISSATVTLSEMAQGNNKQAAEISTSPRQEKNDEERMPPLEVDYTVSSPSKDGYTTDSELFESKKDEIQKTIADSEINMILASEDEV